MKAILVNDDRSLRWDNVPDPEIKPDEVLVEIHAAALNRADLMQRDGDYPPPPGCPEWMGLEVAGVITQIGEEAKAKSKWKIGDKVCALLGGGGYAEYVAVKYDMLMPVPENCSMIEAAAIPEAFATAYLNLFIEGNIKPGNTLLMNAGASGLASVIIPMAKAFGIRVITTVLSDEIKESIKHLNADRVVVTTKEDIAEVLKEEFEKGRSVDVAIDCLGGEIMGKCIHYLTLMLCRLPLFNKQKFVLVFFREIIVIFNTAVLCTNGIEYPCFFHFFYKRLAHFGDTFKFNVYCIHKILSLRFFLIIPCGF